MYGLEGKVALVTGAGGENGIGRGIATRLALEGADVVVNDLTINPYDDRPGTWGGMTQVVEEIKAMGRKSTAITADVSNAAQVQAMVDQTIAEFGSIDILVNNAGSRPGGDRKLVVDVREEDFSDARSLLQDADRRDCETAMVFNYRFFDHSLLARQIIATRSFGKVVNITGLVHYAC